MGSLTRAAERRPPGDRVRETIQDPRAIDLWDRFASLVFRQSEKLALVAEGDRRKIYTRHILDSLGPLGVFDLPPRSLLDLGSGAGFPGIPLAIAWPETRVALLEARGKKVGFLERAVRELRLANATAISARLEDYGRTWQSEPVDVLTVRAVGGLPRLLKQAARAAAPGARWAYFVGSGERAAALLETLESAKLAPRLVPGLFGGSLLVGALETVP